MQDTDTTDEPIAEGTRSLVAHNESSNSLNVNLTEHARKRLGWEPGDKVEVKLYENNRIVIESGGAE